MLAVPAFGSSFSSGVICHVGTFTQIHTHTHTHTCLAHHEQRPVRSDGIFRALFCRLAHEGDEMLGHLLQHASSSITMQQQSRAVRTQYVQSYLTPFLHCAHDDAVSACIGQNVAFVGTSCTSDPTSWMGMVIDAFTHVLCPAAPMRRGARLADV